LQEEKINLLSVHTPPFRDAEVGVPNPLRATRTHSSIASS